MNTLPLIKFLLSIRPGSEWSLVGDNFSGLQWIDKIQDPPLESDYTSWLITYDLPTPEDYSVAIQSLLDNKVKDRGYIDAVTCASYDGDQVAAWSNDAKAFKAWRSVVWRQAYAMLDAVQSGQMERPTVADVIAGFPVITWPS